MWRSLLSTPKPDAEVTHLASLRREFDRAFAQPAAAKNEALVDVLPIRVGGLRYALRALEVSQIVIEPRVAPLPSPVPELAGICAVRGSLVPVYDLAALLGHTAHERLRYIALVANAERELIGLGFEGLEGHTRLRPEELAQPQDAAPGGDALIARGGLWPLLQMDFVLGAIERRLR